MNAILSKLKTMSPAQIVFYLILALCFVTSVIFVTHNHSLYDRPLAEVTETSLTDTEEEEDENHNQDTLYTQDITAELKNGKAKGEQIHLTNEYSSSGALDQEYEVGNELFVSIDEEKQKDSLTGSINDVKRDKYVLFTAWIFIFVLLIVGKKQGLASILSLAVNAALLTYALDIYVYTESARLLWVCGISAVLFTIISLLIVNGFNEKTYTAIIATLIGTGISLAISYAVLWVTSESGLRYEEMEFLTRPYQPVFLAGLLLGSLGGVMDIAITIASSVFGLYESNQHIAIQSLKKSGMDIGKDIMGTITNILFFVYISGSIPMLIMYLNNGSPLTFSLSMNLSLELARALAGGIGIVLTIPIGVYTAIFFVKRKREKS